MKCLISVSIFFLFLFHSLEAQQDNIIFLGAGDAMLGSIYPKPSHIVPDSLAEKAAGFLRNYTKNADISFLNLEGVIAPNDKKPCKCSEKSRGKTCFEFGMPESVLPIIKNAGFNVVSLNNNHVMDYDWHGYKNSVRLLGKASIKYSGRIGDIAEFNVKGKKIALLAFGFSTDSLFYSTLNIPLACAEIRSAKQTHDIVIVSFHAGAEGKKATKTENQTEMFLGENRGNSVDFAHAVISAGADLVVGHGPHVPRAFELFQNKLIAYSLGNFFTFDKMNIEGISGYAPVLTVHLDKNTGNFSGGTIVSFVQKFNGVPFPDEKQSAAEFIARLTKEDFPTTKLRIEKDGKISKTE